MAGLKDTFNIDLARNTDALILYSVLRIELDLIYIPPPKLIMIFGQYTPQDQLFKGHHEMSGRYELQENDFKNYLRREKKESETSISLKSIFPDLFQSTSKAPTSLLNKTRNILDKHFESQKGWYCFKELPKIRLLHAAVPGSAAKAKTEYLKDLLHKKALNVESSFENLTKQESKIPKTGQSNADFARILREGLGANPSEQELNIWAERILQDIYATGDAYQLPSSIWVIKNKNQKFIPLWNPLSERRTGCLAILAGLKKATSNPEKHRRDFINLISLYINALSAVQKNISGTFMVSLNASLLYHDTLAELYIQILKRLHPKIRQCIALEIIGLKLKSIPQSHVTSLKLITGQVQGIYIQSNLLQPGLLEYPDISPSAYGLNPKSVTLPFEDQKPLIEKFRDYYAKHRKTVYAKNVSTTKEIDWLKLKAIPLLSGPGLAKPVSTCLGDAPLDRQSLDI